MRPLVLSFCLALGAPAQVRLVADLHPGMGTEADNLPARASAPGITWLFGSAALWRTDGTVAGTQRLQRFLAPNALPQPLAVLDGVLLFAAPDAAHGNELWRSDGTPQGTWMVGDLLPGPEGSIVAATKWRGAVWLYALHAPVRASLWRSDGTRTGTIRILDFDGWVESLPELVTTETRLLVVHNEQLFATDGTAAGTTALHPKAWRLRSDGERVWFYGLDAAQDLHLWRSDGTVAGTRPVLTPGRQLESIRIAFWQGYTWFNPNPSDPSGLWCVDSAAGMPRQVYGGIWPLLLTPLENRLLFVANSPSGAAAWSTDGTTAGTRSLAATNSGFARIGERAVFLNGSEVRVTDGTVAGTHTVADLAPGSIWYLSDVTLDGHAFFVADRAGEGRELWVTDGTSAGTHLVRDIRPGAPGSEPRDFSVENGLLLFTADDGVHGRELWRSDGTAAGTFLLGNLGAAAPLSSWPTRLVASKGATGGVFFLAGQSRETPRNLRFSDGTAAGTHALPAAITNAHGDAPIAVRDGIACFGVYSFFSGTTLWRSDGTVAGTMPIQGLGAVSLLDVTAGDRTFWALDQDLWTPNGQRLWRSDGTAAGTAMVRGWPASAPLPKLWVQPLGTTGERVWILGAAEAATGVEPWISDGTTTGTQLLLDIAPGPDSSDPAEPALLGNTVFFVAEDHVHGRELWRSDGTAAGTFLAADVWPGASGSAPRLLTAVGDRLYFVAHDGVHGEEPWCIDATGAHLVRDVRPGPTGCSANLLTALGDRLLFAATDEVHGYELWVSDDATAAGTRLLADLAPQGASGIPASDSFVVPVPGSRFALFGATDGVRPMMLWRTDGTPAGTRLWDDIALGSRAYGQQLVVSGRQVFLVADDGTTGMELFVAPSPASAVAVGRGCAHGAPPPTLRAAGLPTLGNAGFAVALDALPPDTDAVVVLGRRDTALPLGADCVLRVLPPFVAALVTHASAAGQARVPLPVPDAPGLAGQEFWLQAAAATPPLTLSGGLRLVLARE